VCAGLRIARLLSGSYITRECGIVFPKFPMKQDEFIQGANCMASRE
jgi:hypothetical protein